ncbi:pilus assembly FimT family protein [Lutispora thermophila]|uniref:Prepilin-type N-terminal cleavage/methylation domain-containing protein n=1 Tax=Lutispora thermophila DSM 19022 TaxID=1122184 RepID=A0A1M6F452_9FIRM|nr:type II secretion system protein [Lutispora thermophila]SHI92465.1 prepilin-type N-terminal cleavage/methylation domain-containing protein [Lutispora thermophila DSM 19022]
MKKIQGQKGLTIIELIVVIGILCLFASIALPKIDTSNYELLKISKSLRDDIRYIRYQKMTEGENLRILFQMTKYTILEGTRKIKEVKLNNKYSLYQNFADSQVAFSYSGAPSTSGGTITIFNNENKSYCQITVVPGTGRILLKNEFYNRHK